MQRVEFIDVNRSNQKKILHMAQGIPERSRDYARVLTAATSMPDIRFSTTQIMTVVQ